MTKQQLNEIEAREDAASKGPWDDRKYDDCSNRDMLVTSDHTNIWIAQSLRPWDAKFIAEVRRLWGKLDDAHAEMDNLSE